jgi:hypothetical protein
MTNLRGIKVMKNLLISYPRSGNTWLRYCVEFLTKKPTDGVKGSSATIKKPMGEHNKEMNVGLDKPPIMIKSHEPPDWIPDKIILLMRNPLECLPRHTAGANIPVLNTVHVRSYLRLIEYYHLFDGEKLVVNYEDLLVEEELKETLNRVLDFLNETNEHMNDFIENLEEHAAKCIEIYNEAGSKSQTEGTSKLHHSKKLNLEECKKVMGEADGKNLFDRYCLRYL